MRIKTRYFPYDQVESYFVKVIKNQAGIFPSSYGNNSQSLSTGELIAVIKDSLLLLDSSAAAEVSIDVHDIRNIEIIKKSKTVLGLVIGGVACGVAGYGGSSLAWNSEKKETWAVAGAVVGMAVGGMIGSALSGPETIRIKSISAEKTKNILMRLQSQARITEQK